MRKIHFEGSACPEYPHHIITACGINAFTTGVDNEFEDALGRRYEIVKTKRPVSCGRCKASKDFRLG